MPAKRFWTAAFSLATLLSCSSSSAQSAASAKTFLDSAFSNYATGRKGVPLTSRYFHSSLLALIEADEKAADRSNEVPGALDGDPLCNCQEWDGIWDRKIEIAIRDPGRAEATVSFALFGPADRTRDDWRTLRIVLIPEHGAWRIYDIFYMQERGAQKVPVQSFRRQLQDDIKDLARDTAAAHR